MGSVDTEESVHRSLNDSSNFKGARYSVPILRKQEENHKMETLLLAWTLLLYRQNLGEHVQFSWGILDTKSLNIVNFQLNTLQLSWDASNTLATAAKAIQKYLRRVRLETPFKVEEFQIILNDECAPGDSSFQLDHQANVLATWGNIQLRASTEDGVLWIQPSWREPMGASFLANHLAHSLVEILSTTLADESQLLESVLELGGSDKAVIWDWNKNLPPSTNACIHDLIAKQVQERPDAPAICSWDGDFTYKDVDQYSTLLSHHLINLGVKVGDIIPLCFEKSRWTTVAVMAIIKAGGAFVLMDPSQPIQRRQVMASQVRATVLLASRDQSTYSKEIAPDAKAVIVEQEMMLTLEAQTPTQRSLPEVPPDSLLYVIFTSGSTGTPKGVMISHTTYTSSALARSAFIGYSSTSRSLDFTSYAFDVSIDSMLSTLLRGGCLCIPREMDRVNDLSGAIRRLGVNMVNITPSVARILDPDIIPSLRSLGIGGESCSAGDISIWGQHTRVVVGYGPAECTIGCTVNPSAAGKPYVSVGSATGAVIWLVNPDNHNKLVPVGAIGELLIEGPIVGQGYLGDPGKTAAAFIEDPDWLVAGTGDIPGRRGRLYKTGDLVRYDPDGECGFVFVGRKDTQIKLRGQRVELGEIEHHVKYLLPSGSEVIAEIIAPQNQVKESMLVAFISHRDMANDDHEVRQVEFSPLLQEAVDNLDESLSALLPIYMVPAAFIGLPKIPMLVSGKTDRKSLRALGAEMTLSQASQDSAACQEPTSEAELFLRESWCSLLRLKVNQVSTTHNFFMLGGDSVLAMRLIPIVRDWGYTLSVADVFSHPILSDMAKAMTRGDTGPRVNMDSAPFSLLDYGLDPEALRAEAAEHCGCEKSLIKDIYPCAPMQEIHMAFYTRSKENYIAQRIADIPDSVSLTRLKSAWDAVCRECAILRTRIVEFKQLGFMQVVVNRNVQWDESHTTLDAFLEEDAKRPMSPGYPLCRFTIVHDVALNERYFVWTAHHAIYDGWSTDLVVEHATAAYDGHKVPRPAEFKHFVHYLTDPSVREASETYWRRQLEGATGPRFPSLPSRSHIPEPDSLAERFIPVDTSARSDFTLATNIRAAWALLASQYAMSDEVVFGETFTGRTVPVPGAELIEGPLLATIPVRIRLDRTTSVQEFLQSIQEQGVQQAAHEHLGIQHIRRLSPDAQIACEVTMGLIIQPQEPDITSQQNDLPLFRQGDAALEALHFNSYPLMLACSLQPEGFRLAASFDSSLLSPVQVQRLLSQFELVVSQLRGSPSCTLGDMVCLSDEEREDIWLVNQLPLYSPHVSLASGDKYPIVQYPRWVVHPANVNILMPVGAIGELLLEGLDDGNSSVIVEDPEWLKLGSRKIPGRQRKLYRTGDLVKYADDMSLIFVGRKDALKNIDGNVIDLTLTNAELKRLLPVYATACSHLVLPKGSNSQTPLLVAFIQETPPQDANMIALSIDSGDTPSIISKRISVDMATALVGLRKAMVETLPPHAIPSVYLPLQKITDIGDAIDVIRPDWITEQVTLALVVVLRKSLVNLEQTVAASLTLTTKEKMLRSLWSKFLHVEEAKLSLVDNFFRLGGDSIVAMRMVSALRQAGYRLSVATIFKNMQLRSMASALEDVADTEESTSAYTPFSLLTVHDVESFISEHVRPQLADPAWVIQDVMPVTNPQERDVKATVSTPRSSVQYNMLYLDHSIDTSRLVGSFQHLVARYSILRTVFMQHETQMLQVVVVNLEAKWTTSHTDEPLDQFCRAMAKADAQNDSAFVLGTSFIHLFVVHGQDKSALMIRMSHAQYDGVSLPRLLQQLELSYRGLDVPASQPFGDYLHHLHTTRTETVDFWRKQLHGSVPTEIIYPADAGCQTAFFTKQVNISGSSPDNTLAMLLTAAWARVLAQFLGVSDVTFGSIVSGRDVEVPGVDSIMGPCYQYIPVRIKFEQSWNAKDLLSFVRDQYFEGSQRVGLGFREILRECTDWPETCSFFGSFANHLNREFFDTIPFAGMQCRVDYSIPHTEPPTPPRVVSFVERGESFIGIEADEERRDFWEARLEELATAVEGFATDPEAML